MRQNAILSCILLVFHNVCCDQDNWVEPHAWSELSTDQHYGWEETCSCPAAVPADKSPATIEDQLALMYFKKFVNTLFMRDKLKYSKTSKQYKRSMLFTLRQSQIDELETVQDVRDLDILLASILKTATDVPLTSGYDDYSDMHQGMGVFALITDIFKDIVQLLRKSEVQFMLIVCLIISIGWIVKKRFRYSTLATILAGFFFVFLYGYLFTYLECNRKLEVEAMIEVLDSHQNPTSNENSWFSKMLSYLSFTSPEAKQKQKLLKSAKLNLPFCRPDHVFITYMSDTFLKLIEMIIEKSTQSISILSGELSLPFKWIAPVAVVCMVSFMLKLVFQYVISPKAWSGLVHGKFAAPVANTQHAALSNEATTDRLSGDNLKILLNVIGTTTIKLTTEQQQLQMPVSGVQELLEPLEAPPQKVKEKNPVSNVSNSSVDVAMDAGFTAVDDNDEDDEQIENC